MEHSKAVEIDAVGRYLAGEMDPAERDDFEEHYFTCTECGEEVRLGAAFEASARRVLATQPTEAAESPRRRSFWAWLSPPVLAPAALAAALAGILVYQNAITIPTLKRQFKAGDLVPAIVLHTATRGADDVAHVPVGGEFLTLSFDLPPGTNYPTYHYTVTDTSGRTVEEIGAAEVRDQWSLLLRRSRFAPGRYNLTVRGLKDAQGGGAVLATYSFVIE
jgi:hypothetical protein